MDGKIALEEHFSTEANDALWNPSEEFARNGAQYSELVKRRLRSREDLLREMDRSGIEFAVLSLTSPGVQGVADPDQALALARGANDEAAELVRTHPDRWSSFAAVPLQDPEAAADELERAVVELNLKGALVNGYSNIGPGEEVRYLDDESARPFWERVAKLGVPVYLHPREPLPSQRRAMQGYPELVGSAWGFAYETSTHAVRLMLSGLFDRHPSVQVILGHLGEGLPFMISRLQHRLDMQRDGEKGARCRKRLGWYWSRNFYITTSGHFHTRPLLQAVEQDGADRVLFSADFPFEEMSEAAKWFDETMLDPELKAKIGRTNAERLFRLDLEPVDEGQVRSFSA